MLGSSMGLSYVALHTSDAPPRPSHGSGQRFSQATSETAGVESDSGNGVAALRVIGGGLKVMSVAPVSICCSDISKGTDVAEGVCDCDWLGDTVTLGVCVCVWLGVWL